jgi:hypothetical protein
MHENDREQPMDVDSVNRPDSEPHPSQAPAIRLLANPRRVRRA